MIKNSKNIFFLRKNMVFINLKLYKINIFGNVNNFEIMSVLDKGITLYTYIIIYNTFNAIL